MTGPALASKSRSPWLDLRGTAAVYIAACVAMGATVLCGFTYWDDHVYVFQNALVTEPGLEALLRILSAPYYANYQPLHLLSYWIDWLLWDLNPAGLHALNVLLYAGGCALLHRVALRLDLPPEVALAAALLFAVHPVHVEPVAWISARKDCLMLPLLAGACLAWLRDDDRGRLIAFALAAAAALAKSQAMVVPALLLALELRRGPEAPLGSRLRSIVRPLIPFVVLAVLIALLALVAQSEAGAVKVISGGLGARIGTMARALVFDLRIALFPYPLSAHYDLGPSAGFGLEELAATLVLVALVAGVGLAWSRKWKLAGLAAFSALWTAAALAPVSGVVPLAVLSADRYLLLPTFAIALLATGVAFTYLPRRLFAIAVAACAVALAAGSVARTEAWRSDLALWEDTVQRSPGSGLAWANYGAALADAGLHAEALAALEQAEYLRPGDGSVFTNRVLLHLSLEAPALLEGGQLAAGLRAVRNTPAELCRFGNGLEGSGAPVSARIARERAAVLAGGLSCPPPSAIRSGPP